MPPTPSSPEIHDAKRRLILGAARQLLVKQGFQDVALDDVARAAKVAKGTLFLYFKSKEDLFSAAFADLVDQLGAQLQAVAASGLKGLPLLEAAVETVLAHFDKNKDFISRLGSVPSCGDKSCEKILERFRANAETVRRILESCAKDGVVAPGGLDFKAMALFGVCRTSVFYKTLSGREAGLAERRRQVVDFYLNGARPR